jgi:hypothetical protein
MRYGGNGFGGRNITPAAGWHRTAAGESILGSGGRLRLVRRRELARTHKIRAF